MSEKHTETHSLDEALDDRTDYERIDRLTDEEIEDAVREDPDAPELLNREWFETAELVVPGEKKRITMRVDEDVIAFFKRKGRGYQTRMNAVLKAYMLHRKRKASNEDRS